MTATDITSAYATAVANPLEVLAPPAAGDDTEPAAPHRTERRIPRAARRAVSPIVLIIVWQLACTSGMVDDRTLASPVHVVRAGRELWATGELQRNLLASLDRVALGLVFGVGVGLVLAIISGLFRIGEDLIDPVMQLLRSVPVLGLIPLVIIWFGIGETSKAFLVALGTAFPVYINTHGAIRGVDHSLVEVGRAYGLGRLGIVGRVILPGALPGFLVGLRFALVGGWLIMIVAEQINARSGLGYLINQAQSWYRTDIIVLGLAIYATLGILADGFVRLLERRLLSWRNGFTGS